MKIQPLPQHEQHEHFAGFDWAGKHHDVVIIDVQGSVVDTFRFDHSLEGWAVWKEKIRSYPTLGVMVETSFGIVIEQLLQSEVTVYPINPLRAKHYRKRYSVSGTKTDYRDAYSMAFALRNDLHEFRALKERNVADEELRIMCRDHIKLTERRTALVNQLQQSLREYYPAAMEAFDDWTKPYAWNFILRFPTAERLKQAGKRAWEKFLHSNRLARPSTYEKRLAIFATASGWAVGAALVSAKSFLAESIIHELFSLQAQIDRYEERIAELTSKQDDFRIFTSLPGAGAILAPRMFSDFGTDRNYFRNFEEVQILAGTAPTRKESGNSHRVVFRWNCDRTFRHTMYLFAACSINHCTWARVYYQKHRAKKKSHAHALRCLGQRWLKIIWRMWHTKTEYDGEFHARNQLEHGSWVLQLNDDLKCEQKK